MQYSSRKNISCCCFFFYYRKKINFNMKNKNDLFFWGAHVHNEFPEMYFMNELKQEKSFCKTHDLYLSFTIVCYI